tara:strand:+ start:379 stop:2007 length:1629 start_codon:yes stop_codon:yes gene_type:complete
MNRYSRIFHHIDFKEAKNKHLEDLAVKKLEEEKNIKKEKQISKITEEKKYSWRETLKEAEWVALDTGGIANKTTQTFGLTDFGMPVIGPDFNQVTANFGGLGGVDVHPSEVAYNGAEGESSTTPPPTYNQLALAGFTKPLPMLRRQGKLKADEINARLDSSQQVAQKANADVYMNARIEADKKYQEELEKWDREREAVDEYNRKLDDEYEKEKERVRVYNERIMMAHHRTMSGVRWDSKRKMGIPTNTPYPGSDLDISNRLTAKYWIPGENGGRGVLTITPEEWSELHCKMGGCANEAKRKALEKKIKPFPPERPTYKEYPPKPEPPELKPPEWYDTEDGKEAIDNIPVWSAKAVFDRYMEFLKNGPHTDDVDITDLIAESDIDFLLDLIEKYVSGGSNSADKWSKFVYEWNRRVEGGFLDLGIGPGTVPNSLRNILGHIAGPDLASNTSGEGFFEDADYYYIKKHYDFTDENDLKAPIICNSLGCPSADYAKDKGIMQWFNTGKGSDGKTPGDGNGTPTMYMVIKIPKNKKKKKDGYWSTP